MPPGLKPGKSLFSGEIFTGSAMVSCCLATPARRQLSIA
jgi:hypothetical protein